MKTYLNYEWKCKKKLCPKKTLFLWNIFAKIEYISTFRPEYLFNGIDEVGHVIKKRILILPKICLQ